MTKYMCVGCSKFSDSVYLEVFTGFNCSYYLCEECAEKKAKSLNTNEVIV